MKIANLVKFVAALAVCLNLASANSLEQIKKDGVIRIGTIGIYKPFTYHNEKDELVGYDVDIAREVAKKLGVEAKFIEYS
jgi:L-cystine-binding protein tcyA